MVGDATSSVQLNNIFGRVGVRVGVTPGCAALGSGPSATGKHNGHPNLYFGNQCNSVSFDG